LAALSLAGASVVALILGLVAATAVAQQSATTTGGVAKSTGPTFPGPALAEPRLPDSILPANPRRVRAGVSHDIMIDPGATPSEPEIAQKGDEHADQ
jgi:hypothetical protein